MTRTCVYRVFDLGGEMLYVGITEHDPAARVAQHRRGTPWGARIAHFTSEQFDTRAEASQEERRLIKSEAPEFNTQWAGNANAHPLRKLREARFMSASELARALECSERAVGLWESGRGAPRLNTAFRIAEILDVSGDDVAACFAPAPHEPARI